MEPPEVRPVIETPYEDTFGMFRDDPTFAAFLAEVEKYRRQGNEIDIYVHNPHVGVLDSARDALDSARDALDSARDVLFLAE